MSCRYPDVLAHISHVIDPNVPVKDGRFAYMSGKNDTDEGLFNVYTGSVDLRYFNRIDKWNGRTELPWWESGTPCAKLLGTSKSALNPDPCIIAVFFLFVYLTVWTARASTRNLIRVYWLGNSKRMRWTDEMEFVMSVRVSVQPTNTLCNK